jgi:hypothetical protein
VLTHWESRSRGSDLDPRRLAGFTAEIAAMRSRWSGQLESDPFFSPNLSLETTDAAWAFPPRTPRPWEASPLEANPWRPTPETAAL